MTARDYRLYGLRVRSAVPLPAPEAAPDRCEPDLRVSLGETRPVPRRPARGQCLAELSLGGRSAAAHVRDDRGNLVLRFYEQAEFRVAGDLEDMIVHPDPHAPNGFPAVLLAGSVLAFVLCMRGATVLHASAVAHEGRVLAIVGASGQGKSSLAARLCARGTPLVTDDVLRLTPTEEGVVGWRGPSCLRLRQAADPLAAEFSAFERDTTPDGRIAVYPPSMAEDTLPLGAALIVRLDRGIDWPVMRRLQPADGLVQLVRYPRVLGWRDNAVAARDFPVLSEVSRSVPVLEARVPWGARYRPDVADALLARVGSEMDRLGAGCA